MVKEKLKKLRGCGLTELRVRSVQELNAYLERARLSPQLAVPSDRGFSRLLTPAHRLRTHEAVDGLLAGFRARAAAQFFPAFGQREATVAELRTRWPAIEAAVLEQAERIRKGRFDLLGRRNLFFGDPVDWHFDPVSGIQTPLVHWTRIDHLNPGVVGEYKVRWELNRHQYFVTLGKAYWYTQDEGYAETFVQHLTSWMDANPPKLGINWSSSLELAFRAISWCWGLHFFRDSPQLTPAVFRRVLKFLYLHGRHIETYLSTYYSPNTHLTGEALALCYLGTVLPDLKCAPRWREKGERILMAQLDVQIRNDGVYFEQSTYYHRYTADFYIHLLLLGRANGTIAADKLEVKIQALLDHIMFMTRPDGTMPLVGDDDGGRLVKLDSRAPNDFRSALATGAVLFSRPDYRYVAGEAAEETLWLLGPAPLDRYDELQPACPAQTSCAFPDSGYFVMRDGWKRDANYLVVDCGPHGVLNCGHAHADALAFELAAGGESFLIDRGTYSYLYPHEVREEFRSSRSHNTISVDGVSSSIPAGPFQWKHIANSTLERWIARDRFDYFAGAHDGYASLPDPAAHTRQILFLKGDYWIVRDVISAAAEHAVESRLHFAPTVSLTMGPTGVTASTSKSGFASPEIDIAVFGTNLRLHCETVGTSRSFGELAPAPLCVVAAESTGVQQLMSFLLPGSRTRPRPVVRAIDATGGECFQIVTNAHEDLLAMPAGKPLVTAALTSDFEWTWVRRTPDHDGFLEMVLIGGQHLSIGESRIESDCRIGFLSARFKNGCLHVDTDGAGQIEICALGAHTVYVNGMGFTPGPTGRICFSGRIQKRGELIKVGRPLVPAG